MEMEWLEELKYIDGAKAISQVSQMNNESTTVIVFNSTGEVIFTEIVDWTEKE